MKAVLIKDGKGPAENLYLGDVPTPDPRHGEVLVKVKAFGLNRMDIIQRNGNYPPPPGASEILGVEFSGIVEALGDGESPFKVGDEVFGLAGGGAYAEYIIAVVGNVLLKPANLTWVQAASVPENFLTAFQALIEIAALKEGEDVLIHAGASGVGIAATQIASLYKAKTVIATASSDSKLKCLKEHRSGPTHGVNYKTHNFAEEVEKITDSKGVDVVIDFIGADYLTRNIQALAKDGRMTLVGLLSGGKLSTFDMTPILFKRLRIQGTTLRSRTPEYQANLIARFAKELVPYITGQEGDGVLYPVVHEAYPWEDIQKAHLEMESNANTGKIVATIN